METTYLHDSTAPTIFRSDPSQAHQLPIPDIHEHAKGWQDCISVRSYVSDHGLVYHGLEVVSHLHLPTNMSREF